MKRHSYSKYTAILHSKRAQIYYLEYCRVMVKDGRVVYFTSAEREYQYWNIPIANTTSLLLGTGTSITQGAVRKLCESGVMIGFSGGGATPLLSATEVEWLSPQSEYRPTEYLQHWMSFWFNDSHRLEIAKVLQKQRLLFIKTVWSKDENLQNYDFSLDDYELEKKIADTEKKFDESTDVSKLLQIEAGLTKALYKFSANRTSQEGFVRSHDGEGVANQFLNHGNYLAYGLAASCLWVLGIPHGFAVMHGKTRRGALVFDVADLIKDAIVLPLAFICAEQGLSEQEFRQTCLEAFIMHDALGFMFNTVKSAAIQGSTFK